MLTHMYIPSYTDMAMHSRPLGSILATEMIILLCSQCFIIISSQQYYAECRKTFITRVLVLHNKLTVKFTVSNQAIATSLYLL